MGFTLLSSRSAYKTVSWRIVASTASVIVVYTITGRFDLALLIGGAETIVKFVLYYLHERVWDSAPSTTGH